MGARSWFFRLLSRGDEIAVDPDDDSFVVLTSLPLFDASMLTESLRNIGVDANYMESVAPHTQSLTHGKVFVPRNQLAVATEFLNEPTSVLDEEPT